MVHQEFDLLAKLEHDVLDEAVPLAALLRTCLILAGQTRAPQLLGCQRVYVACLRSTTNATLCLARVTATYRWARALSLFKSLLTRYFTIVSGGKISTRSNVLPLDRPTFIAGRLWVSAFRFHRRIVGLNFCT